MTKPGVSRVRRLLVMAGAASGLPVPARSAAPPAASRPGGTTGGPVVGAAKVINLAYPTYYQAGANPFINQVLGTDAGWEGAGIETGGDGWAANIPAGGAVHKWVYFDSSAPVRTGRYVATCRAPCTIDVVGSDIALGAKVSVSAQRVEFELASMPGEAWGLQLVLRNPGGAALASAGEVVLMKASDEANFNAGRLLTDEAIADMRCADVLRFMDYCGVNAGAHSDAAGIPTGVLKAVVERHCLPPEIIVKMAKEADRIAWICVPWQFDAAAIAALAARYKAAADALGYTRGFAVEYGNEPWNFGFAMRKGIARVASAEGLTLYDNGGAVTREADYRAQAAYAHRSLQCWAAFEARFGRAQVYRCLNLQSAWFDGFGATLHYVDPATGLRLGQLADFASLAPYFNLDTISPPRLKAAGLPASVSQRDCLLNKYHLKPESFFDAAWRAAIDTAVIDGVGAFRAALDARGFRGLPICMYEGGDHEFLQISEVPTAQSDPKRTSEVFLCVVNTSSNTLDIAAPTSAFRNFAAGFDDADRISWCYLGAASQPISSTRYGAKTHWAPTVHVRVVAGGASLELYNDAALTSRITLTASPGVTYGVFSNTRVAALTARLDGLMDSPFGAALYRRYWSALRAAGVQWIAQYDDVAYYKPHGDAERFNGSWGLKRSHYQPNGAAGAERFAAWAAWR